MQWTILNLLAVTLAKRLSLSICRQFLRRSQFFLLMVHRQLHPSPRQQLATKVSNFHNCCSVLANAGEPAVMALMERLTDWDKFYMLKAYEVIRIEFPVEDVQQSSAKLRLSG